MYNERIPGLQRLQADRKGSEHDATSSHWLRGVLPADPVHRRVRPGQHCGHHRRDCRSADQSGHRCRSVRRRRQGQRHRRDEGLRVCRPGTGRPDAAASDIRNRLDHEAVYRRIDSSAGGAGQALARRRDHEISPGLSDAGQPHLDPAPVEPYIRHQGIHGASGVSGALDAQETQAGSGQAVRRQTVRFQARRGANLQQLGIFSPGLDHREGIGQILCGVRPGEPVRPRRDEGLGTTAASGRSARTARTDTTPTGTGSY